MGAHFGNIHDIGAYSNEMQKFNAENTMKN